MQCKVLTVNLTRTFDNQPLAVVDNLPGGGAELRPAQLRALAIALQRIADDCEARPATSRNWAPARRDYPLSDGVVSCDSTAASNDGSHAAPGQRARRTPRRSPPPSNR